MTKRTETGVMMMSTRRVVVGTRLAASVHQRSAAYDAIDNCDLCDVIRSRDARDRIENRRHNREREGQEKHDERHYDYYVPYYDQPHWEQSAEVGHILGGIKA
jgi:hypothetical protein